MKKLRLAAIAISAVLLLASCSSQYYNGTHKSHPKHTCSVASPTNDAA